MGNAFGHTPLALGTTQPSAESLADALEVSELRYRRLFETARDGILILDSSRGKITDANPFMAELLGYSQDELLGKELWEIGLLKDKESSQAAFLQLQQEGFIRYENLPLETRRGEQREVEFVSNLYREGKHTVIQCNIRDITQRKADQRESDTERDGLLAEALEQADRDSLTGLLNHHAFHRRLEQETIRARRESTVVAVVMLDLDSFKFFNDVYGHTVGDQVLQAVAERLKAICRPYDAVSRFGGDEFALLLVGVGPTTHQEITTRLRAQTNDLHFLPEGQDANVPIDLSVGVALFPDHHLEHIEILNLADSRMRRAKMGEEAEGEVLVVREAMLGTVNDFPLLDALVTAVDNKDRYTRKHSEDVMDYSLRIARELGMSEIEQRTVAMAALIHDVGKIGVPDVVLRKPGRLTDEEYQTVKRHPHMGAAIISAIPGLEATLDAVRHHHERWDGQGYPLGLQGEEIPFLARILAVADAFSAITMDRPYRKGIPQEEALLILEAGAGTQWEASCVAAFGRAQKVNPAVNQVSGW